MGVDSKPPGLRSSGGSSFTTSPCCTLVELALLPISPVIDFSVPGILVPFRALVDILLLEASNKFFRAAGRWEDDNRDALLRATRHLWHVNEAVDLIFVAYRVPLTEDGAAQSFT